MSFTDAIAMCFRKYAAFSGRAARPEYWWFVLFLLAVGLLCRAIDRAIYGQDLVETIIIDELTYATIETAGPVASVFWLLTVLPFLTAGWRRMHDIGRSGLMLFAPIGVFVGLGAVAVVLAVAYGIAGWKAEAAVVLPLMIAGLAILLTSIIWVVWLLTRPGQPGTNDYGPTPHEVTP